MRVAFFGGSFNPPHVAHQLVALYVLETAAVDELWMVPCGRHPFDKALAPYQHRLRMCELAAAALGPRLKVSDIEDRLGGESHTLVTIKALRAEHPGHEFWLVVGADLEPELSLWHGAEELLRSVPRLVVGRGNSPGTTPLAMPALSSTDVRARLARGEPVTGLLPRAVESYIREQGLYG
ncbi:MAG: nicotinate (nicotinamide) nucleotide adenylyltransferase [Deltaproteobacteria bacterium]|nr:nicotinate (nicotinamide) nucleotide adenylyltransferase [Deltaproteobacteria bacterium]